MAYTNSQDYFLSKLDRCRIFWQCWIPTQPVVGVLIFQHGFGEHSDRYQNLLSTLEGTGLACYAMEARGHGRSEGKRGYISSFDDFVDDMHQFVQVVIHEQDIDQVMMLGHSMGGVIAIQYALSHHDQLQGLILSSPGIRLHMTLYNKLMSGVSALLAKYLPNILLDSKLDLDNLSHDKNLIEDYKTDPLVHSKVSPVLGNTLLTIHKHLYEQAHQLTLPLLVIHGTADKLTDPDGSKKFFEMVSSQDKTLKLYDGLFHETMNEVPVAKAEVLNDIKEWLEVRMATQ